jgi:hypothetical protein
MLIKEKIKLSNADKSIKLNLGLGFSSLGQQQDIDSFTQINSNNQINSAIDNEVIKFKYDEPNGELLFYFNDGSGNHNNSFKSSMFGISVSTISNNYDTVLNSFFIADFYDTFDINTQNKLSTNYLTDIVTDTMNEPRYSLKVGEEFTSFGKQINELYYINLPKYFISSKTNENIVYIYVKFMFYCSNNGGGYLYNFYNYDNRNYLNAERMFVKIKLDISNKTWEFITPSFTSNGTINLYELTTSNDYINKINDNLSLNTATNIKQKYPTGKQFDYDNISYV